MNLIYDELLLAWGYGVAQYFTYAVNDCLILGIRGEIWRDEEGFFVAQFRANNDFIHIERGDPVAPDPSTHGGGRTTYLEITGGVTLKPRMPKPFAGLLIRPEVRYDRALTDRTNPFDQLTNRLLNNHIYLPVKLNGGATKLFIFDTGSFFGYSFRCEGWNGSLFLVNWAEWYQTISKCWSTHLSGLTLLDDSGAIVITPLSAASSR